ncbi:MAG TPA: response regulator [Candidatus Paceibacterota bacterium]|nr:response regulator [Candidatus Paceibacterota bacterium]
MNTKKIIIVEADPQFRNLLKLLSEQNFPEMEILTFRSGVEGLEAFHLNEEDVALIITGNNMSVMSGAELAEKVKAVNPKLPILLLGAIEPKEHKADQFLPKTSGLEIFAVAKTFL